MVGNGPCDFKTPIVLKYNPSDFSIVKNYEQKEVIYDEVLGTSIISIVQNAETGQELIKKIIVK